MSKGWPKGKLRSEIVINKTTFMISSESIQAKIWHEISDTYCWIINRVSRFYVKQAYIKKFGEIPKNENYQNRSFSVCHKCDCINGLCVNPDHLFLGTDRDNAKDRVKKLRKNVTTESIKKTLETKKENNVFSSSSKKAWKTRRIRGNAHKTGTPEGAKKGYETKKRNGTLRGGTSVGAKKTAEVIRQKGTARINALKAWETRRRNLQKKLESQ